jgi:hypothetical protein
MKAGKKEKNPVPGPATHGRTVVFNQWGDGINGHFQNDAPDCPTVIAQLCFTCLRCRRGCL